jgi:hypothetical protein
MLQLDGFQLRACAARGLPWTCMSGWERHCTLWAACVAAAASWCRARLVPQKQVAQERFVPLQLFGLVAVVVLYARKRHLMNCESVAT